MLFSQGTDNVFQTMKLERNIQPDFATTPMRGSKWETKGVIQSIINGRILTDLNVSSESLHFNSACSASAGVRGGFDSGVVTMTDGTSSLQIEYLNCIERKATLNGKPITLDR